MLEMQIMNITGKYKTARKFLSKSVDKLWKTEGITEKVKWPTMTPRSWPTPKIALPFQKRDDINPTTSISQIFTFTFFFLHITTAFPGSQNVLQLQFS
jgi:hypothetical protein